MVSPGLAEQAPVTASIRLKLHGRVLVVEDNPINQRLATMLLTRHGIACDCVGNGFEAVDARQRLDYDVLLMDCKMPEMDGYAATAAIPEL